MELHICKQCGLVAPKGTTVCPRCGRALPPTNAEASRPRYTIHVDPDMVQYWDDEDEDEFPLKEDPFFMWYGGEQQEEMGTGHYLATLLLFAIPVVGLIMMIYWSLCGSKWEERQKLATACMIKRLVGDLVILALLIAAHSVIVGLSYMPILLGGMGYYKEGSTVKASVIIPNLNGAGWLRDSIESIWAQTEQDFELIVIDNGSTDESLEIARSYCGNPRYHLIENSENTGFSHAVNQGIAMAKGEYMALFNNDAFAEPNWLEELLKTAESDPKIFAVSSLMLRYYEPELADDAGDYVTILGFACKRGDGLKASRYQKPCRIFSACGGAALYRKSILDKIGVFDELFFAYYEDVDLSWRANNFGYKNVYCPTAKCRHICGATTGAVRYNPFKSIQSGRNSILLPYKNQPVVMLVVNFIPMLLGYLLKVIMFRHRGFGNDYAKGYAEAKIALPKIKKPKFYWRNLPNYLWCEGSMIVGLFRYLVYRVQRALKIT